MRETSRRNRRCSRRERRKGPAASAAEGRNPNLHARRRGIDHSFAAPTIEGFSRDNALANSIANTYKSSRRRGFLTRLNPSCREKCTVSETVGIRFMVEAPLRPMTAAARATRVAAAATGGPAVRRRGGAAARAEGAAQRLAIQCRLQVRTGVQSRRRASVLVFLVLLGAMALGGCGELRG